MTGVRMKHVSTLVAGCVCCIAFPAYAGAVCEVASGPGTAALVELYTSEGCSSCPPADRQLSELGKLQGGAGNGVALVLLGLHVGYWDQIGWKDVFAQKAFETRQARLATGGKGGFVYTPQFFVNGKELRQWRNGLSDAIRQANLTPAQAGITLKWRQGPGNTLQVEANGTAMEAGGERALFVAISESGLVTKVLRGENSNVTLKHDDTVRDWAAPVKLVNGSARLERQLVIPPDWKPQNLRAVAFVQDLSTGAVLQAVSTASCEQPGKS
ncbi:MAG: hypothetical protein JWM30_1182 [Burkholderia sp.]|nr:hypothetical protein [Burkholderia sp.]